MIAHPKALLAAGPLVAAGAAAIGQGLQQTPVQIGWVLGGLVTIGTGIGTVVIGYLTVQGWMQRVARTEAKVEIAEHSKDAASRTRNAVAEAISNAGKEQAQALREHIGEEREVLTAIRTEQIYQRSQNEHIIKIVEYLKGDSSPTVPRLPAIPPLEKLSSRPGEKK